MRQNIYNLQKGFKTKITKNPTGISSAKEIYARFLMIFVPSFFIAACSTTEPPVEGQPDSQQRTPIELSVGIIGEGSAASTRTATRNVVTVDKPYNQYAKAFDAATSLYMVMKSEENVPSSPAKPAKYTSTVGTTGEEVTTGNSTANEVNFADNSIRYWEDAHSRNSRLSIYSACVPGKSAALSNFSSSAWGTSDISTTIAWPLNGTSVDTQDADFIDSQDLCFSNNVSNLSGNNPTDNRIGFGISTNKFDSKLMIFYHALTKITFKIERGAGFDASSFTFTNGNTEDIVLKGFNTGGTFDIVNGEFTASTVTAMSPVNKLADTRDATADDAYAFVRSALLVPGTNLNGSDKDDINSVSFTIANNTYHITKAQLYTAVANETLSDHSTPSLDAGKMRPGVHYIFKLKLGKKEIDKITAAVVPWEEVEAEQMTPSNASVTVLPLYNNGDGQIGAPAKFDLYRTSSTAEDYNNWTTGYSTDGKATLTWNSSAYSTNWYWPDNSTYYHFRAVSPTTKAVSTESSIDYITLNAGESNYDVCWGAPFHQTSGKLTYSQTSGFDNANGENHQIYKAIGPVTSTINLTMFHMMSEVTIQLKTEEGSTGEVDLGNATVQLSGVYPTATVRMSDGLVTPTGTAGNSTTGTVDYTNHKWTGGFIPQDLTNVKLTITAAGNQYIVDMKDILATVSEDYIANLYTVNAGGKYIIDRWYPCFKYTYTFNLTKSGVTGITATLLNWEDVKADEQGIQIK